MAKLPLDIMNDLFSRLPPKTLLRFRCLSTEFCSLIDSHDFIKLHLHCSIKTNTNRGLIVDNFETNGLLSEVDLDSLDMNLITRHDPLDAYATLHDVSSIKGFQIRRVLQWKSCSDVIGSCNGLIALYNGTEVALWNPSTRKHQLLAKFWGERGRGESLLTGFGYDVTGDDYKLVAIFLHYRGTYSRVTVYSLVKNSARTIEKFPDGYGSVKLQGFGTLVATCLHWVVAKLRSNWDYWIVAFDLNDEKFHMLPTPDNSHGIVLGVLGGCLSMGCKVESQDLEIWMMKEYGVKDSWTKLCSISAENGLRYNIRPLCFSKISDRILFVQNGRSLYWYDQANSRSESACCVSGNFFAIICVRSLVPINASTRPVCRSAKREMTQLERNQKKRANTKATGK